MEATMSRKPKKVIDKAKGALLDELIKGIEDPQDMSSVSDFF